MNLAIEPAYLRVSGTPYEVGKQQGEQLRYMIQYTWRRVRKRFYDSDLKELETLLKRYIRETEKRFPEEIEEIQGIADGAELDFLQAFLINRHLGYDLGCTCLAFQNSAVGPIAGGNLDDDPIYYLRDASIKGQNRCLMVTWPGVIGCGQGINEHGLANVGTSAKINFLKQQPKPEFITDQFAVGMRVLRNCRTVPEAIEFLKRPDIASYGNIIFADAEGNVARVEKYLQTFVSVRYPDDDGFIYAVNCLLSEYSTDKRKKDMEARNSDRITALEKHRKKLRTEKRKTVAMMKEILSDRYKKDSDWSISNYRTYMSTIAIPKKRQLLVSDAPPHLCKYKTFTL